MIAAIFLVPIVYFINAFLIGRLLKRWKININPFLASITGFVAFFVIIYFISIWMYASHANIWTYFVVMSVVQTALIGFYIANWRYIFITWSVNWRKIVTFSVVFALVILIGWLNFRSYQSEFGKNWIWAIQHTQLDIWKPMWFGVDNKDIISNFSAFNVMNMFWIDAFSIIKTVDGITFCNWSWTIIGAAFFACLATWIYGNKLSTPRMIISMVIVLLFAVLILAFIETLAIGDAWILMLLFAYVFVMVKQDENHPIKLFILTALLLGFLAASCTSFYTVICVWIFSIYYVVRNKQNTINYLLFLSWPLMLTVFSFLSIYTYWLLSLIDAIYLAIALIGIGVYIRLGTPSWDTRIAMGVSRNSGKIIYAGLGLFIALILVANFFIFQEVYRWNPSVIDYKNFLTFTYTYIWKFKIKSVTRIAVFNAIMYFIFLAVTITYIVIRKLKHNKLNPLFKQDSALKFAIVSCILFINPLVIHVLKISTARFPLNTLDLNMLFVVPIFVFILKIVHNYKYNKISEWKYDWY